MRFNSLQTGRSFRTQICEVHDYPYHRFQFPSNGKVFPNPNTKHPGHFCRGQFQFPSNGKVFPNGRLDKYCDPVIDVSIPFKREGISELKKLRKPLTFTALRFDSLQTGSTFRTWKSPQLPSPFLLRFNSLQTGRSFRTQNGF